MPYKNRPSRWAHIPRIEGGCVYAVELNNGVVKVGFSANPRSRMGSLAAQIRRSFGALHIVRFHIGAEMSPDWQARRAERETVCRLSAMGSQLVGTTEFFTGVRFGQAVNLIKQLSGREFSWDMPPLKAAVLSALPPKRKARKPAQEAA